jgi:hypothetical protein
MSGIQRWSTLSNELRIASASYPNDDEEGEVEVVTYTDHAAYVAVAVAEAEQRGYMRGFADQRPFALAEARDAVAALIGPGSRWSAVSKPYRDALAAINKLEEKP